MFSVSLFVSHIYALLVKANRTVKFQLKNGQYRADLAIRLADDILPAEIKDRARAVVEKCRTAADGERM
jgi:hypothetical protein